MANRTMDAFSRVTSAIRGGGFLGILESVIGLGFQLGSIGVFGKNIATKLNTPRPAHANGTDYAPGGLSLVGERGPEWVNLPRGSKVWPNGTGPGGSMQVEVVPSPYFDVRVDSRIVGAAGSLVEAGGQRGKQLVARAGQRRVR
jgi:SLT domain-containing protein